MNASVSATQHDYLMTNLRGARIATRRQGGKDLSYLESWEVRAHLIRVFGFGNFDLETLSTEYMGTREYMSSGDNPRQMYEPMYRVTMRLTVRDQDGHTICVYSESAVGANSGSTGIADLHDNAIKSAASDAFKRCAINLGTQFGLSLYDNGSREDVVKYSLVRPEGAERGAPPGTPQQAAGSDLSAEGQAALEHSLGATPIQETPAQDVPDPGGDEESSGVSIANPDGPQFAKQIDTPEAAAEAIAEAKS